MSPKGIDRWTMIVDGSMHVIGHDEGFDRVLGRPADDDEDALSIISTLVGDDGLEVLEENVLGTISDGDRRTFTLDDEMLEVARMDIGDVHCAIISHFEDAPSCQSRTLERLVLMNSALARINASDRLDDVLDTILDVALEITGYDKGGGVHMPRYGCSPADHEEHPIGTLAERQDGGPDETSPT